MTKIIKFIVTLLCTVQAQSTISSLECTDGNGKVIKHGDEFFPKKEDPCLKCTCQDGQMVMCRSVSCSPPKTCKDPVPIPGKCCEFNCKDGDGFVFQEEGVTPNITGPGDSNVENTDGGNDSITTLGLRLVASTVTSFLVLALLLFMIHRLRQKRLLVAMRRYRNNRQRERLDEMDADSFSPEFLGIRCPPYEDPPPPYSPPKPEHIHQDAPPPYEVIDSQNNNNTTVTQGGGNQCSGANSYSPQHSNLTSTNHILASDSGTNQNPPNLDVLNNNDIDDEVATIMTRGGEPTVRYTNSCHPADHRLPNRYINNCDVQTGAPHADLTLPQGRSRRSHGRNRSEPRNSSRNNSRGHLMSYFPRHMDYDMWDESSTATSLSEYHTSRPSRRRSYLDSYSKTFDNSLPPYLSLHLDLDDTSTEASSNVTGYNPVCHHRYGSLPVNSSFSGQSTHTRNSSHDGSREVHHNNVAENPDLICDSENFKSSQDNDEEFNVSVSNMSSSYRRPCNPENPAAINALENDSVLALEDRNRKLEQIFDSQKLRILRLSKLLQNPSGDNCFDYEHDVQGSDPLCHAQYTTDMCRSQSQNSGLSVCSETGEKKLTRLAESAIGNDAQYPENAIGRYPPLSVNRLPEVSYSGSVSGESLRERNVTNHTINQCDSDNSLIRVRRNKLSFDNHKFTQHEPNRHGQNSLSGQCKISRNSNPNSHHRAHEVKHSTAEKIVQTDKKLIGKSRSKSKSRKSDSNRKSLPESKAEIKGQEFSENAGKENQHGVLYEQGPLQDRDIIKPSRLVEELKSIQRHQGNQNSHLRSVHDSTNFSLAENGGIILDNSANNAVLRGYESGSTIRPYHNVKRSDSYSSGKSKSSSGGETTLLCPPSVTLAKKKSKSSKRLRNRKSCPTASSDVHSKKVQETMNEAD